jgi:AAA+ ATPase superfamily predicted ATPase
VLLEDADGILREELSPTGGYAQILAAIGRGRTRFSHIAGDVGQRIDHALAVLIRTGFVAKVLPVGAPRGARGTYEIPDPYLRFWFQVLYTETALIEGGTG